MSNVCRIRDNGLHDDSPGNIDSGVVVGRRFIAARLATKVVSTLAIRRSAMLALRTRARGVARVHEVDQHPGEEGLVLDETPKLKVGPGFVSAALRFANRYPAYAQVSQVLQGYSPTHIFRLANQLLADAVVHVFSKTSFPAGELLQVALGGFRSRCLKLGADALIPGSALFDSFSGVHFPVRVGSEIDDAEIDSERPSRIVRLGLRRVHRQGR